MFHLKPKLIAILTALGLIIVAAVYLIAGPKGNGPHAGASQLAAYATGAVANFNPAPTPAAVPDLTFQDGTGKPLRLSEFRGRLILLNLWATWCVPCREEMPALDALQAAMGSDRFQVLALSVDKDGLERAGDFLKELKAGHIALYNDPTSRASFQMKAFGLPTTVLVGPDGHELGRLVGPAHWNTPEAKALIEAALRLPAGR
jgi:thiol-disulfide isomerase/thioredoxin